MHKICKLINTRFTWILEVDGENIPFNCHSSAEYFAKHYDELGYTVEWVKEH